MADEKPKSFRIADVKRPVVRAAVKPAQKEAAAPEPSPSAGFPAIESRLENSSIDAVADELRGSYEKLEAIANGNDRKLKPQAKKAMAAYERTADLFEYLFATKDAISKQGR